MSALNTRYITLDHSNKDACTQTQAQISSQSERHRFWCPSPFPCVCCYATERSLCYIIALVTRQLFVCATLLTSNNASFLPFISLSVVCSLSLSCLSLPSVALGGCCFCLNTMRSAFLLSSFIFFLISYHYSTSYYHLALPLVLPLLVICHLCSSLLLPSAFLPYILLPIIFHLCHCGHVFWHWSHSFFSLTVFEEHLPFAYVLCGTTARL